MISGIYKLIDGSLIHQLRSETISNNLANQNTNAFKKDVISFNQTLTMKYVSEVDFSPGPVRYTGNELDVALEGKGFFNVETPRGIRYTRDGAFSVNAAGMLVTHSGDTVLGQNGPVKIDGRQVTINSDGQVVVDGTAADTLMLVDFQHPELLGKEGGSVYLHLGEESEVFTADNVRVKQNYIESSNVNPTEEIIKMMEAFRAFESAQKAIQTIDEITGRIINDQGLR